MSTYRYEVIERGDGYATLMDTWEEHMVMTNSGDLYIAPVDAVRWTAVTLDKRFANTLTPTLADEMSDAPEADKPHTSLPARMDSQVLPEAMMSPADQVQALADQEHEKAIRPNPAALLHVMVPQSPRHAGESEVERERRLGQEATDREHARALRLAHELGTLEARVHGLRAMMIGVQAGLGGIPDSYDALKARLATEDIAQLRKEIERIIATFS